MRAAVRTTVIASLAAAAAWVAAGPLSPPAGPVAPSYKTLSEIEPRTAINATNTPGDAGCVLRITQPGSYYLTGNVTGVSGKMGILIAADDVTVNLNGFRVQGVAGSFDGIATEGASHGRVTVRNGSVTGWGGDGIDVATPAANNGALIEWIQASGNGASGIRATFAAVIRNCTATGNTGAAGGFSVATGSVVESCVAKANADAGFVATESVIRDCVAIANGSDGFRVANGCRVEGSIGRLNGTSSAGAGIHLIGTDNRVEGNTCTGQDAGIQTDTGGNFIARNTASGNTTNYSILGTQTIGPIITATGTITTTSPWANFEF